MEHKIEFEVGHNCMLFECLLPRKCTPENSHGRHGMNIRFSLGHNKEWVQFHLYTGWEPHLSEAGPTPEYFPMPADLGYHSPRPLRENQDASSDDCKLTEGVCYCASSASNAEVPFRVLTNLGIDALWEYLEAYHRCTFAGADFPSEPEYPQKLRRAR